jgi:hypothetical protein
VTNIDALAPGFQIIQHKPREIEFGKAVDIINSRNNTGTIAETLIAPVT